MNDAALTGAPIVLAQTDLFSSTEAVDGSECSALIVYDGSRVHELWIMARFIMPSGREYEVCEIRWTSPHGNRWIAHVKGRRPVEA